TPELCKELYDASLDNVQVTVYSHEKDVHNRLVGVDGYEDTVRGIANALEADLGLSVNTPLCLQNRDYAALISHFAAMGVKYFTCSALIPTGNALGEASIATRLSKDELQEILTAAVDTCKSLGCEISFTSPGWFNEEEIRKIGLRDVPTCGACLSNMSVRPDGGVVPCQSWLSDAPLGNLKTDPWQKIWNHRSCKKIRAVSAEMAGICQLNYEKEHAVC
ncbi:MAG: radical SAM protein, partial [Clostridia bacterium]|nr:radical SAM protein [Clostridia bacterium]